MRLWKRFIVELYDEDGYRGCWEPESDSHSYDESDLKWMVEQAVRGKLGFQDATLQFCEDGDDLIIGVFDNLPPPSQPRRGVVYTPSWISESN